MKKSQKVIVIISAILIIIYIAYAIFLLIVHPADTYIVKQGTLSEEEEVVGYIIREEKVVKEEGNQNGIYAVATEGQKVSKNEAIFRYYSDNEKEITNQINELNYQIQDLLENEENPPSADIKAIENQIEDQIEEVHTLNNYQEIIEYKKNIDELISKKINFIGDITENKEIKKLVKTRKTYEDKLKSGNEYQYAEIAGTVSYRVDGLEDELSPDNLSMITEDYLEKIDIKTGQIISTSSECGKVINNFKCYIAVTMDSENAKQAAVGKTVKIRTTSSKEIKAKIAQINEESGKRTIIFQLDKVTDELINHRKIALDVIWWEESGLKVPNQVLVEENGLNYVVRNKAGTQTKLLVKIKGQTDKFSIITYYEDSELEELGLSEKEIKNYKKITNYDEIMLEP